MTTTTRTYTRIQDALADLDLPGAEDPFGFTAIQAVEELSDLRVDNGVRHDVRHDDQGRMMLWQDSQDRDREGWARLPEKEMVVGSFVELPLLRYHPTIQVVSHVDPSTDEFRARCLAWDHIVRDQIQPGREEIIETRGDYVLVETRFELPSAPVHVLTVVEGEETR